MQSQKYGRTYHFPFSPGTSSDLGKRVFIGKGGQIMLWQLTKQKDWASMEKQFTWLADMQHVEQHKLHHAEGNVAVHTQLVLNALQKLQAYQVLDAQEKPYDVWRKQNRERAYPLPENVLDKMLDKLEIPQVTEAHEVEFIV